jgi:hypothetical protein
VTKSLQVIVKKANKYLEKCPVYPLQFDILTIEREKKLLNGRRAIRRAFCLFGGDISIQETEC